MDIKSTDTALVITDPQNDVLSEKGVAWALVGKSIAANRTVEHIGQLFKAAKANGYYVFISPHYYYPSDKGWRSGGAVEAMMHETNMFGRKGALSLEASAARVPTGSMSSTSKTARRLSPARTRYTAPSRTILCCSCASVARPRSC